MGKVKNAKRDVEIVRLFRAEGASTGELARKFAVSKERIRQIVRLSKIKEERRNKKEAAGSA